MATCIYCRRDDPPCGFNREHVVPQALGTFEPENLVLHDSVCEDCNDYFGRTLDLALSREALESLFRFRLGRRPSNVDAMFRQRVELTVPRDGSRWGGVRLRLSPPEEGDAEPTVELVPQVGFERPAGSEWDWFTEEQLSDAEVDLDGYTGGRTILFDSEEAKGRLLAVLDERGIPFQQEDDFRGFPPFESGELDVQIRARFDAALARAVAKIGFNYLAFTQGVDFALRDDFDATRTFIRNGEGAPPEFVQVRDEPILSDDSRRWRQTEGHLLTVGWNRQGRWIVAHVSPYNRWTYAIRLTDRFEGVWREIRQGHLLAVEDRRVHELQPARFIRPVLDWPFGGLG